MSKIKTFSFFIVALVILITITYFLNNKEITNNKVSDIIKESINLKSETEKSQVDNLNDEIEDEVVSDNEENNIDNSLFIEEEESFPSTEEDPIVTEIIKLNQTADIAKNYVLNNQLYIDDKGFNLETMNVMADDCDNCWTAELSYEITRYIDQEGTPENYFKNITISLENEEIKEVIWEGQALDTNE